MHTILLFFALTLNYTGVFSYNILMVDDVISPSHQIWNYAIVEALLAKGHNVTLLGPKTIDVIVHENYSMYEIEDLHELVEDMVDPNRKQQFGVYETIKLTHDYAIQTCFRSLKAAALTQIINYPKDFKFDLIIFDISFGGCLLPLVQRFRYPPSIAVTPFLLLPYLSEIFGNTVNPAQEPFVFAALSTKMNFLERIQNYFYTNADKFLWSQLYKPKWTEAARKTFGDDMATLDQLQKHLSLLLANIMQGFHYSRPLAPNIIPVGGLHIRSVNKLPTDIQQIMHNSRYGVILFALGTNVRTADLDVNKVRAILEAFSKFNETIFWKFDLELEDVPKNVILRKWLPQSDLLAHPKTKLFISHCGALSTIEAVHYGVPIVAVPFFVDQHLLANQLKEQKWANVVDFKKITAKNFYDSIVEVLHNPEYRNNVQMLSRIVRDQAETPLERAIFWIEYAIRHNGTHFLDSEARHLPLFIKSSADVHLFLLGVILIVILLVRMIILYFKSKMFSYVSNKKSKKKN